ncbi:uncharacterized protein LOC115762441 [Drosophila novamexicana]|uniref:uncharacterized protein LOC115762441 n=1 Tax=Drosophila novamexicana TaxID=47314 RepID=UPI0011E5E958|nr:uncharacterized protein LOC115762441 [Drosophila novamexicana]
MSKNLEIISDGTNRNYLTFDATCRSKNEMPKYLTEELVNDVFNVIEKDETYHTKISSSDCHSYRKKICKNDNDDMDPRLKCWNKVLRERKVLQDRIERHTGKRSEDVLFNRHATIDEQTKRMLLRLMDSAARSEGVSPTRVRGALKMRQQPELCRELPEMLVTEPKLRTLEFVGLPEVTQLELAGTLTPGESKWQRSEVLGERLEAQAGNIKRVLTYCPEIKQLQVSSLPKPEGPTIGSKRMGEDMMCQVSTETSQAAMPVTEPVKEQASPPPPAPVANKGDNNTGWTVNNVIRINGVTLGFGDITGVLSDELLLYFQCEPMHRICKTIVQLENIGTKFVQVRWQPSSLQNMELQQHMVVNSEFLFDNQPFVLLPGEKRRIDVMYQPLRVGIKKQRWCMNMLRSPFCGARRLYVRFHGICTLPVSHRQRLDRDQRLVVDKRNRQVTERLAKLHAELAPIVDCPTLKCPYERPLDERELFSALNAGFMCERYADLETLKELYSLVKKPRQPAWDYRLDTMRQCIYQHKAQQRETLQNILTELLGPMRCNSNDSFGDYHFNLHRERSCFLYVRGIVCSTIEEWEALSETLGQQFFKCELQRYVNDMEAKNDKLPIDSSYVEWLVSRKVMSSKFFKDALYIQTYTLVCDAAENIVSAIESTGNL